MVALSFVTEFSLITLLLVVVQECTARSLPSKVPWVNPCRARLSLAKKEPAMQKYAEAVDYVKTQLAITNALFAAENENIEFVYSKIKNVFDQEYGYEWLPKKLLAWYNEEVHGIPHLPLRMEQVLPVMHTSLQSFAAAFFELQRFGVWEVNTDEVKNVRNDVIFKLNVYLLQLLCEVESAMSMLRMEIPPTTTVDSIRSEDSWDSDPDHTTALIQEWGVISSYRRFVEEWSQVMSKVHTKRKSRRSNH